MEVAEVEPSRSLSVPFIFKFLRKSIYYRLMTLSCRFHHCNLCISVYWLLYVCSPDATCVSCFLFRHYYHDYSPNLVATPVGIEPTTVVFREHCSNHLSYGINAVCVSTSLKPGNRRLVWPVSVRLSTTSVTVLCFTLLLNTNLKLLSARIGFQPIFHHATGIRSSDRHADLLVLPTLPETLWVGEFLQVRLLR